MILTFIYIYIYTNIIYLYNYIYIYYELLYNLIYIYIYYIYIYCTVYYVHACFGYLCPLPEDDEEVDDYDEARV